MSRLILQNAEGATPKLDPTSLEERWIIARIDATRVEVEAALTDYEFAAGASSLYHLVFDDFCDWFAEAAKPRLYDRDVALIGTALAALERLLVLLHPVMPHVTEEIWGQFHDDRLIAATWPEPDIRFAADADALSRVQDAATTFRRSAVLVPLEGDEKRIFDAVVRPERVKASGDADAERARLSKEISRSEGMLANEKFAAKAPADVVAAEREKLERYRRELEALG